MYPEEAFGGGDVLDECDECDDDECDDDEELDDEELDDDELELELEVELPPPPLELGGCLLGLAFFFGWSVDNIHIYRCIYRCIYVCVYREKT
jgi:hypothetical protein